MQVIRFNTWLCADDALKIIELLDALREALVSEHYEGIVEIMQHYPEASATTDFDRRQLELPLDMDANPPF